MRRQIANLDAGSAGGPLGFDEVGVDAIIATLTDVAHHAVHSDLIDVTSAQFG
jgi:hypothetical protein